MQLVKKTILIIAMLLLTFMGYVQIVNRNNSEMTGKQKILKTVYPFLMWVTNKTKTNTAVMSNKSVMPPVSFYSLALVSIDGTPLDLSAFKGKKILIVNTASDCGYTRQYESLQALYEKNKDNLVIIGCPSNDFKEQEKGSNQDIASFCKKNYGVTFPLLEKGPVLKSGEQQTLFQWLTDPAKNGWNEKAPTWNFSKYLIDENGRLTDYFDPSVEPEGIDLGM